MDKINNWNPIEEQIEKELEIEHYIKLSKDVKEKIRFLYNRYNILGCAINLLKDEKMVTLIFYIQDELKIKELYCNLRKKDYNINKENLQDELYNEYKKKCEVKE